MAFISEHTAACFTKLGKFFNTLMLYVGQGDNCYLIFEKQIDVMDSGGPSEALHLQPCYPMSPFYSLTCPFGSDHGFAQCPSEGPKEPGKNKYNDVSNGQVLGEDEDIL